MKRSVQTSTPVRATLERVRDVLTGDPGAAVADRISPAERQAREFHTTLHVDAGKGGGVEQDVLVDVGLPQLTGNSIALPISWRAAGRTRLFPTFAGELQVVRHGTAARLDLRGTYELRLGPLGRLGDRLAGRRLARQSLDVFAQQAATRLESEIQRRSDSFPPSAMPYPDDLRDR